jgi:hypothetical protein
MHRASGPDSATQLPAAAGRRARPARVGLRRHHGPHEFDGPDRIEQLDARVLDQLRPVRRVEQLVEFQRPAVFVQHVVEFFVQQFVVGLGRRLEFLVQQLEFLGLGRRQRQRRRWWQFVVEQQFQLEEFAGGAAVTPGGTPRACGRYG